MTNALLVCGDPQSDPVPRANEVGGTWYRGIITGQYRAGQVRHQVLALV